MAGIIPSINTPSSIAGEGVLVRDSGLLSGHIFQAGLEQPDILKTLIIQYPQYYLTTLSDKFGSGAELNNNVHSWNTMGRTRKSATLTYVSGTGTATIVVDTDIADGSDDTGYFLVGDVVRVANTGTNYKVTAVTAAGGFQRLSLQLFNGGNITQANVDGYKIGHVGTAFGEGSSSSGGFRTYFPTSDYAQTQIMRRAFKISRSAMAQKTWIDDTTWQFKNEDFERKEFMRDVEATILLGSRYRSSSIQGVNQQRGILEYATGSGQSATFTGAVQESDWQSLLKSLYNQNGSNDLIALCGRTILFDTQNALADRYRSIPNAEKPAQLAGLNFQSYEIAGKRVHFAYYEMFSDTTVLPSVAASSIAKDFENLALVLDFQNIPGVGRNIEVKHLKGAKMIQKMIPGMAGAGLEASNAFDGIQGELLTEFATVCYKPNLLGLLYSVG